MNPLDRFTNQLLPQQRRAIEDAWVDVNLGDLWSDLLDGKFGPERRAELEAFIAARLPQSRVEAA